MAKREKKRWSEMTPEQRIFTVVGAVIQMALLAAALRDISRRPADQIRGSKRAWRTASFVNFVGPIAYFLLGRKRQAAAS
jgi:hypothetical protein